MDSFIMYKDTKILVSQEHYNQLSQFKWSIRNADGYVYGIVNKKKWYLHRYIMIELLGNTINTKYVVDHINHIRCDNRIENLRIVTHSDNSRNSQKRKNATSKYFGVSFNKRTKKWRLRVVIDKCNFIQYEFINELHAAYQYNLLVKKFNIISKLNDIEIPLDFIEPDAYKRKVELPKGIQNNGKKLQVYLSLNKYRKISFPSDTVDNAMKIRNTIVSSKKEFLKVLQQLNSRFCKKKNKAGNYVYIIKNQEIVIDKDMYALMSIYNWYLSRGYIINTKNERLSRLIMNCTDQSLVVDHINGNTFDNRKCNLRIVTKAQNALNRMSNKNSSSQYLGVSWFKASNKWSSSIKFNGKRLHLGYFDREQDAALARDYATKKYFKEFGKLNFPERPGWDEYYMNIAEQIKTRSPDYHQVGSVLVSLKDKRIISTGYNSVAPGLDDDSINWSNRDFINEVVTHSEANVLLYANSRFEDSILYTTTSPCVNCLKMLSAARIKEIVYKHEYRDIVRVQELAKFFHIKLREYENIR